MRDSIIAIIKEIARLLGPKPGTRLMVARMVRAATVMSGSIRDQLSNIANLCVLKQGTDRPKLDYRGDILCGVEVKPDPSYPGLDVLVTTHQRRYRLSAQEMKFRGLDEHPLLLSGGERRELRALLLVCKWAESVGIYKSGVSVREDGSLEVGLRPSRMGGKLEDTELFQNRHDNASDITKERMWHILERGRVKRGVPYVTIERHDRGHGPKQEIEIGSADNGVYPILEPSKAHGRVTVRMARLGYEVTGESITPYINERDDDSDICTSQDYRYESVIESKIMNKFRGDVKLVPHEKVKAVPVKRKHEELDASEGLQPLPHPTKRDNALGLRDRYRLGWNIMAWERKGEREFTRISRDRVLSGPWGPWTPKDELGNPEQDYYGDVRETLSWWSQQEEKQVTVKRWRKGAFSRHELTFTIPDGMAIDYGCDGEVIAFRERFKTVSGSDLTPVKVEELCKRKDVKIRRDRKVKAEMDGLIRAAVEGKEYDAVELVAKSHGFGSEKTLSAFCKRCKSKHGIEESKKWVSRSYAHICGVCGSEAWRLFARVYVKRELFPFLRMPKTCTHISVDVFGPWVGERHRSGKKPGRVYVRSLSPALVS